jgi:colicin import membrane protein
MTEGMSTATETAPESPAAVETEIASELGDLRSNAAKAVEEALKAAEADAPKPKDDPEAPDVPAAKTSEKVVDAPAEPKKGIGDILSAREKAAEPKTEAQKLIDEAKRQSEEIAKLRAELDADKAAIAAEKAKLAKLRDIRNAPEALKEMGWEPEDFIATAARANTPEGKLEALIRAQAEELAALKGKADSWEKQAEEQKTKAQKDAESAQLRQVEESFQKVALDMEKYPTLARLYGDDDEDKQVLLMKAHNVARRYRAATGGEEASFEQIADYLEERAQAKLGNGANEEQASSKNGKAQPGGRPTGKRTLNGSDASVRTSAPAITVKVTDDLDDLGKRARQAAERAIRESGA